MPLPTLGQMIAALGSPPEWAAIDPSKLLWDNVNSILYINGEPVGGGGESGFFVAGVKDHHFYNDEVEVGIINDGFGNVGFGLEALSSIAPVAPWGNENTAMGYRALASCTTGQRNVAIGSEALEANISGHSNIAVGAYALELLTGANYNIAIGETAMYESLTNASNIAIGSWTLVNTVEDSDDNIAIGTSAMEGFIYGESNIAIGLSAFGGESTGDYNIAIGSGAYSSAYGGEDSYGAANVAIGAYSLWGWDYFGRFDNIAIGFEAMCLGHVANYNVAVGGRALRNCYSEELSVAIGLCSLQNQISGYGNVAIGAYSGKDSINLSCNTFLGYDTMTDQMNGHSGNTAKHHHDITPTAGIEKSYVEYAFSFVFDGVDESNLIPDNIYFSMPGSYGDGKTYEMHLTAVPICTTTDSPRICTARKIYRYFIGDNDFYNSWGEYKRFRLVGTIEDNTTTEFLDSMTYTTLLEQDEYFGLCGSIALGNTACLYWGKQLVVDAPTGIKDAWFGNGVFDATPVDFTLNPTGGYGANKAGANLILAGGRGTGTANGGSIKFQVTPASGGSGSLWNPLANALIIDSNKVLQEFNDTTGAGTPQLGTNCPANTLTGPYTWWKIKTSDSSIGYIPVWV